jgi:type IV pilus assembly protein PilE
MRRPPRGFTLIELMIAVVIVGILAAIAYPSYQRYVVKASREAVQSQLIELANLQEKIFLNSGAYSASVSKAYNGTAAAANGLGVTSGTSTDGKYTLSVTVGNPATTFTLTATPVSGSMQDGDGTVSIDQSFSKTSSKYGAW